MDSCIAAAGGFVAGAVATGFVIAVSMARISPVKLQQEVVIELVHEHCRLNGALTGTAASRETEKYLTSTDYWRRLAYVATRVFLRRKG